MSVSSKRYRAFISYSQRDKVHARRFHRALERYRLPARVEGADVDIKTRKLGRFFRDDEEMGAATDLGAALQGAIADAENLIVVCSPNAAQSEWVNKEIIHFKRTGRADDIFAVIVAGRPHSADEQECFPPALRFALGEDGALSTQHVEPLAVDLRKERFARVLTRLVAGLVSIPFDALWKREQRRARAQLVVTSIAFAIAMVVFGTAFTSSLWLPRYQNYERYGQFVHSASALTATRPGTVFQDCRDGSLDCPKMVLVPEGAFLMGSPENDPENPSASPESESPQRQIAISRFAVSVNEITFGDWRVCAASGGCDAYQPAGEASSEENNFPVVNVSWNDAQKYVSWLSSVTGRHYRLLSEAEWEYAARAQTNPNAPPARFSWGDQDPVCEAAAPNGAASQDCKRVLTAEDKAKVDPTLSPRMRAIVDATAEFQGGVERTWAVGSFRANAFGLHDMHGNVSEYVQDCLAPYDPAKHDGAAVNSVRAFAGMSSDQLCERVVRGGTELAEPRELRSASRSYILDSRQRVGMRGFRVARDL